MSIKKLILKKFIPIYFYTIDYIYNCKYNKYLDIFYDLLVTVSVVCNLFSCSTNSGGLSYWNTIDCFCSLIKYL